MSVKKSLKAKARIVNDSISNEEIAKLLLKLLDNDDLIPLFAAALSLSDQRFEEFIDEVPYEKVSPARKGQSH